MELARGGFLREGVAAGSYSFDDAESKLHSRSRLFLESAGVGAKAEPSISKLHVGVAG